MQKIFSIILALILAFSYSNAQVQPGEVVAEKIAQKMKDSLSLTNNQQSQLFAINMQLNNQKSAVWQHYSNSDSLISIHLQKIENTRDSLYRQVLPEDKYLLYKSKKRNLVNNN